jgi:hypothetical protein
MGNYHEALMKREGIERMSYHCFIEHLAEPNKIRSLATCATVLRPIDEDDAKAQRPIFGNPYRNERKSSSEGKRQPGSRLKRYEIARAIDVEQTSAT